MCTIAVHVSEELAAYWEQLAQAVSLPVETWLGLCGCWGAALELPITRIVLRQPPAANVLAGVTWEVGEYPNLSRQERSSDRVHTAINKVFLLGNLGNDPEILSNSSGQPVARLSLVTKRQTHRRGGSQSEKAERHCVVCFGRQAEIAARYLTRNQQIYVEGRLQTRSWTDDRTRKTRYRTEIVCENLQMLGQRQIDAGTPGVEPWGPEPEGGDIAL